MNEQESAYGSESSSTSSFLTKKDDFTMKNSASRNQIRWKWLKHTFREYMVLDVVVFLILVFLLITCYRITSQNQETQRMISEIQSQLNSFQKPVEKDFVKMKQEAEEMIKNEYEKMKAMSEEVMKEVRMKSVVELEQSKSSIDSHKNFEGSRKKNQSIINNTSNSEETHVPPIIPTASTNSNLKRLNAASYIAGSRIDRSLSSSPIPSQSSYFDTDEINMVLVDRQEPPANRAWCTSEKNPVLTVNLAKYINPTAVSYQHSKWNGTIPDDAPKMYSVEACLDFHCRSRKPLFSTCQYNPYGLQEQICNNTSHAPIYSPVAKLQFRFHKNHGNTETTCVSLVRVYSETEVLPEKKLRRLEDKTTCLNLNHDYHHNPRLYKYLSLKNCTVLYTKGCCEECPECCEECRIEDFDSKIGYFVFMIVFMIVFCLVIFLLILLLWGLYLLFKKFFT